MLQTFKNGQGSIVLRVKLLDSSSTTGAGLTGLLFSSTGLIISTIADNEATATAYTAAGSTTETITTLGTYAAPTATKCRFKEVDATNHKGVYEFQFADARFAVASAKSVLVSVLGATNLQQADFVVQLQSDDPYVAKPTNSNLLSVDASGRVDVIKVAGTTQTAGDLAAMITAVDDLVDTEVGAIKTKTDFLPSVTAGDAGGLFIAGANAATSITTALTANIIGNVTGNLSGSVGSVTGAVGSVTGLTTSNLDVAVSTLATAANLATAAGYIDTEVAAIKAKTDNLPASPAAVGSEMTLTTAYDFAKGTVAMTEGYAADGATATPSQMMYMLWSLMAEKSISSTTLTAKKLDGTTSAMVFTLSDATSPTSITRAS